MGQKGKSKRKELKKQKKRAVKAANKAKYAAMKQSGENSKSKRFTLRAKRTLKAKPFDHPQGPCGNIGCKKCDSYGIHRKQEVKTT
jgi:hypothetical protein